eukprot:gene7334-11653_t
MSQNNSFNFPILKPLHECTTPQELKQREMDEKNFILHTYYLENTQNEKKPEENFEIHNFSAIFDSIDIHSPTITLAQHHKAIEATKQNEQYLISKKRHYKKNRLRTNLVKRCSNSDCDQYYETIEVAQNKRLEFQTQRFKSTHCFRCGNSIRYYFMGKWQSSALVSKNIQILKLNNKNEEK